MEKLAKITKNRKIKLSTNENNKENTKKAKLACGKAVYCICDSIGVTRNVLCTTSYLLATDTQRYLVAKSFLSISWINEINNEHNLNLFSATNDPFIIFG